jgi:hypothetical protein
MSSPRRFPLWLALGLLAGCGIENFGNLGRTEYDRPASAILGTSYWPDALPAQFSATDGENVITPFLINASGTSYELRLPSSKYSMIEVTGRVGNLALRAIVPSIGEESKVTGVALDERTITEAMIVEARLSADGQKLKQVTPDAYLGTRNLIYAAFDQPGPTQDLLNMVKAIIGRYDATLSQPDPDFFNVPIYDSTYAVKQRAVSPSWIARQQFDYTGDGRIDGDSVAFDQKLAEVAKLYRPAGCADPNNLRVVFTVDFNTSAKNGNCANVDRFKWATDKPGKSMFFVGWVHKQSVLQEPGVNNELGASTPNQIPMYDDGTNGDEVAGDNIWTISFVIPKGDEQTQVFRIGYKFTWGTRGALWTGSEEWPGNSRILEVVDVNHDGFVYRHETWGDEASNKDASNLNPKSGGTITWTTDLHGCGPEARENTYDFNTCGCDSAIATPKGIGPIKVACTQ